MRIAATSRDSAPLLPSRRPAPAPSDSEKTVAGGKTVAETSVAWYIYFVKSLSMGLFRIYAGAGEAAIRAGDIQTIPPVPRNTYIRFS